MALIEKLNINVVVALILLASVSTASVNIGKVSQRIVSAMESFEEHIESHPNINLSGITEQIEEASRISTAQDGAIMKVIEEMRVAQKTTDESLFARMIEIVAIQKSQEKTIAKITNTLDEWELQSE